MAIHLQDPFENKPTDTPMTTIAQSIEKNILQIFQRTTQTRQHVYAENDAQVIALSEWNNNHITAKEERLFNYWGNTTGKKYFVL